MTLLSLLEMIRKGNTILSLKTSQCCRLKEKKKFSYIVPNTNLSLHAVGAAYQVDWERTCRCNGLVAPTLIKLVAKHDNHVLAWYCWKKQQRQDNSIKLKELQQQDDLDAAAYRKVVHEKDQAAVVAQRTERWRLTTLKTKRRELDTPKKLLEDVSEGLIHNALLNTWSNVFMPWKDGGDAALKHHRKVLSTLERN